MCVIFLPCERNSLSSHHAYPCPSPCLFALQVVIPVVSVQLIKKHKTARLLPNGLAITTNASRKVTPVL